MITSYRAVDGRLILSEMKAGEAIPEGTIWLDVREPDDDERLWVEKILHEDMLEEEELDDLESSSRYRAGANGVHILSLFPQLRGDEVVSVNMSFSLTRSLLFSFREEDISVTRMLRANIRSHLINMATPLDVLICLHDRKVEQLSDMLEDAYARLEETAKALTDEDTVQQTLKKLVCMEELNSQILLALNDTRRGLRFIRTAFHNEISDKQDLIINEVLSDIDSIQPHTSFLNDKINFQLSVLMGSTNSHQNKIIKIFSVASVVFMPPTWIASVYGMNFEHMPELGWLYGYPFAIGMMIVSAVLTYFFFKRKGWL